MMLTKNVNTYLAMLIITVVGAGASMLIIQIAQSVETESNFSSIKAEHLE